MGQKISEEYSSILWLLSGMTFILTPPLWALNGALAMGAEEKIKQNHNNKNIILKNHDK